MQRSVTLISSKSEAEPVVSSGTTAVTSKSPDTATVSRSCVSNITTSSTVLQSTARVQSQSNVADRVTVSGSQIIISNIPGGTSAADLRSYISIYGKVVNCKVGMMKTQAAAGLCAVVTMESRKDADYCVRKLHQTTFKDSEILVRKLGD